MQTTRSTRYVTTISAAEEVRVDDRTRTTTVGPMHGCLPVYATLSDSRTTRTRISEAISGSSANSVSSILITQEGRC